jgi:hypothetical protein
MAKVSRTGEDGGHVEVVWTCPLCGSVETDWYDQSSMAYCGECLNEHRWQEVLTPHQQGRANKIFEVLEEEEWKARAEP